MQMIGLRNDLAAFNASADAKITLLKEVIEKVQRGEEVDAASLLGTGDKEKEQEWEDGWFIESQGWIIVLADVAQALKEIEERDQLWQSKKKGKSSKEPSDQSRSANQEMIKQSQGEPSSTFDKAESAPQNIEVPGNRSQKKILRGFY